MENFDIALNEDVNVFNEEPQKIKSVTIERIKKVIEPSNSPYTIKKVVNNFFEDSNYLEREPRMSSKELYKAF